MRGRQCIRKIWLKQWLIPRVMAILYEGWADDKQQAREMLLAGDLTLRPAQDLCAMVPLAATLFSLNAGPGCYR